MKKKTLLGLLVMAGFTSMLFFSFGQQVQGYMNFSEATSTGQTAHVVGTWVEERHFHYDRAQNVFSFYMQDEHGDVRQVKYLNPKPANFEDAEQVVVEGSMQNDVFVADEILVKCPSKYNEMKAPEATTNAS